MVALDDRRTLDQQRRFLVLVWAAFIATLLVYLALPRFVVSPPALLRDGPFSEVSRLGLWVVVFLIVGILWWWNQKYLTKEALLKNDRFRWGTMASNYAAKKIVAFALAEAVAIYGFLLGLIGRYLWDQLVLSGISALLLIYLYPSRAFFDELVKATEARPFSSPLS